MASVAKDFHRLLKRVNKLTDGQVTIGDINWDESTLQKFDVVVRPNDGHYKGGKFVFTITLPEYYPSEEVPGVWCQTDIYHPNIDPTEEQYEELGTNVCLNLFEAGRWNAAFGLEGLIHGLVFLMHNPNPDDPLSPYFEGTLEETFAENVKKYMTGEPFDDHEFVVDFIQKQGVELEPVDKEATGETVEEGNAAASGAGNSNGANEKVTESGETNEDNTATSETDNSNATNGESNETVVEGKTVADEADNLIDANEKNATAGHIEDTKEEYIGLLDNIPKCSEANTNGAELIPESEVKNITAEINSDEDNDVKLHNEINEKNNEADDKLDDQNNTENDPENYIINNELVFDGECLFVLWTDDNDDFKFSESVQENNAEVTRTANTTSAEDDCTSELNNNTSVNDKECSIDSNTSANSLTGVKIDSVCDTIENSAIVHDEADTGTLELVNESNVDEHQICEACLCGETHVKPCRLFRSVSLPNPVTQNDIQSSATNQNYTKEDTVAMKTLKSVLFVYDCLL